MSNIKQVEKKINTILKYYQVSDPDLTTVKSWIYYDGGDWGLASYHKFQTKFLAKLRRKVKSVDQMNHIVDVLVEAWEVFPHQSLAGLSIRGVRQDTVQERWRQVGIYRQSFIDFTSCLKE